MADEKRIAPIPLPAGSFDVLELRKNLDAAVSVKNVETHPERINEAIVKSASETTQKVLANATKPAIPEHARVVERKDGDETVEGVSFKPAKDAETGADAAAMEYERSDTNVEETAEVEQPTPIAEIAAEKVEEEGGNAKK